MTGLLQLRDYQTEAIRDLHTRWDAGATRVPMVLATGLGKTVIFAHLVARYAEDHPNKRALILVHTDELVQQAYKKIKDVAPHLRVGIVKAEQNEITAPVIVASVQTLRNARRRQQVRHVGLVIVDECHHATATTYRTILEHFGALPNPGSGSAQNLLDPVGSTRVKVAGFTATLARGDKAKLSDVWEECTFNRGIAFGIRRGYLTDVRGIRVVVPDLDLSNVRKSRGDFQDGALEEELDRSLAPSVVAEAYAKHAGERKAIGFAPTVASAEHFAEAFSELGIPTAVVHGKLGREERRLILKRLSTGEIRVVWNCAVLTEGFDEPTVSCVINARPTQSAPLYQQMVGRGLRPDLSLPPDARGDCLVLDVVGVSRTHNLRTLIDLSPRAEEREMEMDEDESLLELENRLLAEEEAEAEEPEQYYGQVEAVEFDPLARTGIGAWLQTAGGTYFLPAGDVYVLIVPGEELNTYDVAWLTQKSVNFLHADCPYTAPYVTTMRTCSCGDRSHQGVQGDVTEHQGLSLEMASSWAEEVMEGFGQNATRLADRTKRWRSSKDVSEAQKIMCGKLGITLTGDERKGEVSDLISTVMASRRIDPVVAFMISARG